MFATDEHGHIMTQSKGLADYSSLMKTQKLQDQIAIDYETLFKALFAAYIVFNVDDPHFTIVEENEAHATIAMRDRSDVVGKALLEAFPDTSEAYLTTGHSELVESIRKVIRTGKSDVMPRLQYAFKDPSGKFKQMDWSISHHPIFDKAGKIQAVYQATENITDDVLTKRKLDLTQSQLEVTNDVLESRVIERTRQLIDTNDGLEKEIRRREKIERELQEYSRAKDEFISLASHQLRTPATGVKQYLGMVIEGFVGEVSDSQKAILQKANESNERQLRIVSDLLKVAQVDAGKVRLRKADVDVTSLIKDVIKEQRETFEKRRQTVLFEPEKNSLNLYFDRDTIRMVLENLIDNASKYSGEDKTVTIKLLEHADEAQITIIDNGVGIRREDQDRLFEKFSRIDNPLSTQVGGTGLGLYWAKKIVDLHQGKVTCESAIGKGTAFTIHLPKIASTTMLESKV